LGWTIRLERKWEALHLLLGVVFANLPENASIFCVGAGTGIEIEYLAKRFPKWTFTAVEPSVEMMGVFRGKSELGGYADRCVLHEGYLESLPNVAEFDGATCFLVSQFILDERARIDFFRSIASRLREGGILASSDLFSDQSSEEYEALLRLWLNMMSGARMQSAGINQMRTAYAKDVGILPPQVIGGFCKQQALNCQ
jgi:tRNA (cmo5U34)-methyltransferase